MMNRVVVPKSRIKEVLESFISVARLVAPVKNEKTLLFDEVKDAGDVILNDEITYKSPKEFLFPQTERIMTFTKDGKVVSCEDSRKTIIFGVRPCDLQALKVMTAVFTQGKYSDKYFESKLKNTVIVGFGCLSEKTGCFCAERNIDKGYSRECDIFLSDNGDSSYTADIITEKGAELLEGLNLEAADNVSGVSMINSEKANVKAIEINAGEKELFEQIDWERISEKCLGCGTCTYICPTCHCFGFRDVVENGDSVRYRCWDSCMYPKFTLHASGHNPRVSKKERFRQRIMHKYLYVKQNFGYIACTGCGRCIRSCPAGMNIKTVLEGIQEEMHCDQ
ncbi:MAG: 4Fe-4S dicluster domain-containing protein [Acetivibrionales bacterium]|jgi:sulfhydrogenase subunit beta (sulfur reductase)